MKTSIARFSAIVLVLSSLQAANAGLTATIVNPVDGSSLTTFTGVGDFNFNVKIKLTDAPAMTALQMRLSEVVTSGTPSGKFTLNSVSFATPDSIPSGPWSTDESLQFNPSPQALNNLNSFTSGLIADLPTDETTGTGTFDFATLNITLSSGLPNTDYYLNLSDIVYGDADFNDVVGTAGGNYLVQVLVPAPGAMALGIIGLTIVGSWRRYNRKGAGSELATAG